MATNISPHHAGSPSLEFKVEHEKKQMIIPARHLNIVWGNDNRYWNVPADEKSEVELNQVCWLEVTACVEKTSPEKIYEVGFKVSLAPDAFGWGNSPVYVMVKRGKDGKFVWSKYPMKQDETGDHRIITAKVLQQPGKDKENINNVDSSADKLYFGLYEVWSGKWKGGLKIHHAFVQEFMP